MTINGHKFQNTDKVGHKNESQHVMKTISSIREPHSACITSFAVIRRMHALPALSGERTRIGSEFGWLTHEKQA